jgi:hypothetical protein
MTDQVLKNRPVKARIEQLESAVSELSAVLGQIVAKMHRQGIDVEISKSGSPLVKKALSLFQGDTAKRSPRKGRGPAHLTLDRDAPAVVTGLAAALVRGEAARVEWVQSGEVVPARTLAQKWGLTPQALGPAADRGEIFAVVVKNQRFYPKEFLELSRDEVGMVSKSLGEISPEEKLVFWKRPHGALGGKTIYQVLSGGSEAPQLARVAQLARAWADEAKAEGDGAEAT